MKLMRQLTWCACKYNFTFSTKHVPGVKNNLADSLSRLQIDKFRQTCLTSGETSSSLSERLRHNVELNQTGKIMETPCRKQN